MAEFTCRAAVLVCVPRGEENIACELWERCGLLFSQVEDAGQDEAAGMLYRVEVRLQGSRWGALSEAERRVMTALAGR
ncbi:hypothetical protein [Streptomyces tibetensis]|uniref:hypothetical protein n=1 Tax=Streptomyces tibetensis TaxID=2382123 RepID=UPI0033EAEB87